MQGEALTWAAAIMVALYAYGLGAAAVLVWQSYRGPLRYLPLIAVGLYYAASWDTNHPAWTALFDGTAYAPGEAIRTIASAAAFGLGLLLLARKARGK